MNFDFLSAIKFDELYTFILKNIKQECVFNVISISLNIVNNLNCLMTVTQCFKFTVKLFLKSLISLMILTKINDMKALMKAIKIMILVITVTAF